MKRREGIGIPGVVSARSGCQGARVKPKRARRGRVAGVEPGPGVGLERAQQGHSEHRSGSGESGWGRSPGDHAGAMGEEGGGGPGADGGHGRDFFAIRATKRRAGSASGG